MATESQGESAGHGTREKLLDLLSGQLRVAIDTGFDPRVRVATGDEEVDRLLATLLAAARGAPTGSGKSTGSPSAAPDNRALAEVHEELERQVAERRRQQSLLHYIIANVPFSIFWKDRDGRFLGGNDNFVHDMRVGSMEQLIGKNDYDMGFPKDQADFFVKCDREVMDTGRPLLDIEEPQEQADGTHTLLTSKVPLRDEAGQTIGLLGIYADISERKRMEEELLRAKESAEAAARAKSEFLTVMSHELRTPLTLILGPIEALLTGKSAPLPEWMRDHVERMRRNAGRLFMLVNDILDFSRIEGGGMVVRREPVDVVELVALVIDDARPVAEERGVGLDAAMEMTTPIVSVDRRLFEKILLNLLGNALKFTPAGGRIVVGLRQVGERFELSITDTGAGIPREQQAMLFRRFQQLDTSATRKHEGTGIGLALVKEFAGLLGGEAGVESEPGRGSRFHVLLPVGDDAAGTATKPAGPRPERVSSRFERISDRYRVIEPAAVERDPVAAATPVDRRRVLVGEDNADMRAYIVETLAGDYEVEAVGDGRSVLEAARRNPPDVILSDVMMPEMDGIEVVARLKSDPDLRHVPVILVTARASREELVGGLNIGADDYLGKPFVAAELRARVRAAERLHRLYRELEAKHRELQKTQAELVHAAKMAAMGTLVAGLSHELNNPVAAIVMNAQSLAKRLPQGSPFEPAVAAIQRQAQRCGKLVAALLDFSRQKSSEREAISVGGLLERVMELGATQALSRGITVSLDLGSESLPPIKACLQEIESALLNLVGNAFDATPPGGTVELRVVALRGGVEVSVRDNGSGIAKEVLPRVFDPFFTSKPVGKGTGLGLSVTRRIVEAHGGDIQIDSTLGAGTTIRVWLPPDGVQRAANHQEVRA